MRLQFGRAGALVVAAWLGLGLAASAGAESVYAWRTEDGGYAFTDDEKAIPARYRDQAVVQETGDLGDYARLTAKDASATSRYHEQLDARLRSLRAFNAPAPAARRAAASASPGERIIMRTGRHDGAEVDIQTEGSDEPVVVETILMRPRGKTVSQNVRVVRRGDRVVTIVKPRAREWNVSDTVDEEDFLDEANRADR